MSLAAPSDADAPDLGGLAQARAIDADDPSPGGPGGGERSRAAGAEETGMQAAERSRAGPTWVSLVGPSRLLYAGPSAVLRTRLSLGAAVLYAAPGGAVEVSIDGDAWIGGDAVAVAPYVPHWFRTASETSIGVSIEPESVDPAALRALTGGAPAARRGAEVARHLLLGAEMLAAAPREDAGIAERFDARMLGAPLARRCLDPRIAVALRSLEAHLPEGDKQTTSARLAEAAGVSEDRFQRLFRDQTGAAFSRFKRWKRARRFLTLFDAGRSLTEVAMELGYPDSAWFSNSIRDIFGQTPRDMRNFGREVPHRIATR